MQLSVDSQTKAATETAMENIHPYEAGKNDMREELLALAYDRYCFLNVREAQALELEKAQQTETASE